MKKVVAIQSFKMASSASHLGLLETIVFEVQLYNGEKFVKKMLSKTFLLGREQAGMGKSI